jgi:hypothetical protein
MRLHLAILLLCLSTASASAQQTWGSVHFGQSRDAVQAQLNNQNLPVESAPSDALQTNSDYPLPLPGLLYPIPMMANFHFDANSKLDTVVLSLDLPAMRHDWASIGSDEALYNFAADKLSFALAGQYGAPIFTSPTCNVATETPTPCTIQWHGTNQVIQLESIPTGRHLRIRYLPLASAL